MTARMSQPTVPILVNRIGDLRRELTVFEQRISELEAENAQLRGELAAAMLPYTGHRLEVINGIPPVIQRSGIVYELVPTATHTDNTTEYGRAWRKLPSVPGSPAACIEAALALGEMAVVDDDEEALAS